MDGLKESSKKKRDTSDVGSDRGLGGVMYDETMRMYVPKAHELGCRHDWVHCAEIICQISNLGVSEIAHIEIESYVAQQALQHHFSGKSTLLWFLALRSSQLLLVNLKISFQVHKCLILFGLEKLPPSGH